LATQRDRERDSGSEKRYRAFSREPSRLYRPFRIDYPVADYAENLAPLRGRRGVADPASIADSWFFNCRTVGYTVGRGHPSRKRYGATLFDRYISDSAAVFAGPVQHQSTGEDFHRYRCEEFR